MTDIIPTQSMRAAIILSFLTKSEARSFLFGGVNEVNALTEEEFDALERCLNQLGDMERQGVSLPLIMLFSQVGLEADGIFNELIRGEDQIHGITFSSYLFSISNMIDGFQKHCDIKTLGKNFNNLFKNSTHQKIAVLASLGRAFSKSEKPEDNYIFFLKSVHLSDKTKDQTAEFINSIKELVFLCNLNQNIVFNYANTLTEKYGAERAANIMLLISSVIQNFDKEQTNEIWEITINQIETHVSPNILLELWCEELENTSVEDRFRLLLSKKSSIPVKRLGSRAATL